MILAEKIFDRIIEEYREFDGNDIERHEIKLNILFELFAKELNIDIANENLDATILNFQFDSFVKLLNS